MTDLRELPDTEAEIQDWERKHPEKARRLEAAIDHRVNEFRGFQ